MYDFHYNFIKKIDAELLFTDADSLTYEDVYENFYKDKYLFDLSNYPKDSKFFDPANENVIRKMKDVDKGKPIREFVGIKSKIHSTLLDDGKEFNTAKGVNTVMKFNEYKDILFNKKITRHKMRRIQSKNIKLEHTKSTKYCHHVLMIKDLL